MSEAPRSAERSERAAEYRLVAIAALYSFFLMASYAVLKPLREEMGVQCGARNLKWLWLGTLTVTLAVLPPYWRLVAAMSRQRFVPIVNRAVAATLLLFYGWFELNLPRGAIGEVPLAPAALYVWISVFNMLVLSVFWSFMADAFSAEQSKRRFGQIATGVTCGALAGPWIVKNFAHDLDTFGLLLVSAALLEAATQCARFVARRLPDAPLPTRARATASDWLQRVATVASSPYLVGIAAYLFLSITASTFLYAQRTEVFAKSGLDSATRTALFGWNDFVTQSLTLVLQGLVAGPLLKRCGAGVTLMLQMVAGIAGFALLSLVLKSDGAFAPVASPAWHAWIGLPNAAFTPALLGVLFTGVALKGFEYGLSKPGRESLFTVVSRDEKYQAKSLIDTGLYRFFDQVTIWGHDALRAAAGISASAAAAIVPLAAGIGVAFWLGRAHAKRAAAASATTADAANSPPADRDPLPKA